MFIKFHLNKLRYNEGQMAPFFILILVILIVMALVTVNLSKVSFIKTDTSNAVDAGALAAGSVMANVFNSLAQANSQMEVSFREFQLAALAEFAIAVGFLTSALIASSASIASAGTAAGMACVAPCGAIAPAGIALAKAISAGTQIGYSITAIKGLILSITAYHIAQLLFYLNIRESVDKGRLGAINLGHRFAFINSGIGQKLKEGSPDSGITNPNARRNFRDEFSKFLENIKAENVQNTYRYDWQDGQQRDHSVEVGVQIDPVETYKLKVTAAPILAELALLGLAWYKASAALGFLLAAKASLGAAIIALAVACGCMAGLPWTAACVAAACAKAVAFLGAAAGKLGAAMGAAGLSLGLTAVAAGGLTPAMTVDNDAVESGATFIICWIENVGYEGKSHNRLVRIDTRQLHAGREFGALWQADYPETNSFSIVNFTGKGRIYPPVFRHDPSIIQTDNVGDLVYDSCPVISRSVSALENEINGFDTPDLSDPTGRALVHNSGLLDYAADFDSRVASLEKDALDLKLAGKLDEAADKTKVADILKQNASTIRAEISNKQGEIEKIKTDNPGCFNGGMNNAS